MNTKLITIDAGIRRRQAVLKSKLRELLNASGERDSLEVQPAADPLDQVRQNTERDMAVEKLNQQARSIREIRSALLRGVRLLGSVYEGPPEPSWPARWRTIPTHRHRKASSQ